MQRQWSSSTDMRYAALLFFTSCAAIASLTGPGEDILPGEEKIISEEWAICRERLVVLGIDEAKAIPWTDFKWRSEAYPFKCNGIEAGGCYSTSSKLIRWWRERPTVIRHECGHAILHVLGYKCWKCYEHECGPCP